MITNKTSVFVASLTDEDAEELIKFLQKREVEYRWEHVTSNMLIRGLPNDRTDSSIQTRDMIDSDAMDFVEMLRIKQFRYRVSLVSIFKPGKF